MKISESFNNVLQYLLDCYKNIPLYGLIWSIGFCTWLVAFFLGFCFLKKSKKYILIYIPVIGILATLFIATPVYAEFRYAYGLFTAIPLLFVIPFANNKIE